MSRAPIPGGRTPATTAHLVDRDGAALWVAVVAMTARRLTVRVYGQRAVYALPGGRCVAGSVVARRYALAAVQEGGREGAAAPSATLARVRAPGRDGAAARRAGR